MSRPANHTPTWKNWLLLAVGLWAFLVPSWALVPGNPASGPKNRVWDFFSKTGISCLANPFVSLALASGKVAFGYENRVDPNCCGEQWDADLGLYYNRARFLNTDSGRFWNQDSYEGERNDPQSLHKYLYANANSISYRDPSGRLSLFEVALVNGVIGMLSSGLATIATPGFFTKPVDQQINDLLISTATGFVGGVAGTVVGGPLGTLAGRLFFRVALRPFIIGAMSGAASNGVQQVLQEIVSFIQNPNGIKFTDAAGRTVKASFVGFAFGGILAKYEPVTIESGYATIEKGAAVLKLEFTSIQYNTGSIAGAGIVGGGFGNWLTNIWND